MKKFTKVLVFLLATVALLTAFSVVALASEEQVIASSMDIDVSMPWDDKEDGEFIGLSEAGYGAIYAAVADNGNFYGVWEPKTVAGATSVNYVETALEVPEKSAVLVSNAKDYAYMMLDFDVMTPTGTYETDIIFSFATYKTDKHSVTFKLAAIAEFLDTAAYKWQHVSVVLKRVLSTDADGVVTEFRIEYDYYVNGVLVAEVTGNNINAMKGMKADEIGFTALRMSSWSGNNAEEKTAIDNVDVTYFTESYGSADEMVASVYSEDYEFPYAYTVAKIGETVYDDINEAFADAKEGQKVVLKVDVNEPVAVEKNIDVDVNKYGLDGVATGEFYNFKYTSSIREANLANGIYHFYVLDWAYSTVTWVNEAGDVLATTKVIKGEEAVPPRASVPSGDNYRGAVITDWLNADGEENYVIGNEDAYTFTAVDPVIDENTEYVADVKGAMFNMAYYAQFVLHFYLPYAEDMEAPAVSGFRPAATEIVYISDVEYWCYTMYCTTVSIFDDKAVDVKYTIDGVEYVKSYNISGLLYAEMILANNKSWATEKAAVGNMVRFVDESLKAANVENPYTDRINALIGENGIYDLADYIADEQYPDLDADYSALSEYIEAINFKVEGSYAAYVFTLTEAGKNANISVVNAQGKEIVLTSAGENKLWTLNLRVYDAIETLTVNVTVDGQEAVSGTYSAGAYINATDSDLVRALYAFGVAAREDRKHRLEYYSW